jgi:hypothetical protein
MKLREIAVILAEKVDRPFDIPYLLMLEDRIKLWRSTILRQTLNQNIFDVSYYAVPYLVEMERVPLIENDYGIDCTVLRSKNKLEKSLRVLDTIYFVGSVDFSEAYGKVEPTSIKSSLNRKYSKDSIFYDFRGQYLHIYNADITMVGIKDVLENPEKILAKQQGIKESEVEFFCTNDVIQRIMDSIWTTDLKVRDKKQEEEMTNTILKEDE